MRKPCFDFDLVCAFVAVAESRSFTAAAQRLHCTQSAVSLKIKKLEVRAGCRLFDRDTTTVRLTPSGESFLAPARHLIDVNESAYLTLRRAPADTRLRIAVAENYTERLLPAAIGRFGERCQDVEIELRYAPHAAMLRALDAREVDFVVAPRCADRVDGVVLRQERLLWVTAGSGSAHLRSPVPLAVFPHGCVFRQQAIDALTGSRRPWRVAYTCHHQYAVMASVASGGAVTTLIESAMPRRLRVLGQHEGFPTLPSIDMMLYRSAEMTPVAKFLAQAILEQFNCTARSA